MPKLRYRMDLNLEGRGAFSDSEALLISPGDGQALGELLWHADQGTADDEGQSISASVEELKQTLLGRYGEFLDRCSFKFMRDGRVTAAVVVTFYPKENMPLVAFAMTDPGSKNRGLCQRLLRCAASALAAEGYSRCFLAVNADNLPAVKAYEKVGFVVRG